MKSIENITSNKDKKTQSPKGVIEKLDAGLKNVEEGKVTEASIVMKKLRKKYINHD